jgi:hypothetical protein
MAGALGADISRLVEAINRVGIQNVSLLSRMTGMPIETIRYVLKKRFPEFGLTVAMLVDYERLGLERYFTMLRFSADAANHASEVLERLSKVGFLTYRSSVVLDPQQMAIFAVPVSVGDEFHAFLKELVEARILENIRTERLEWTRHPELKSRYYDFKSGNWIINWSKIDAEGEPPPAPSRGYEPSAEPDIDLIDSLLIKELEVDSWRSLSDIARKLRINERTLRWHYRKHVAGAISSYYVRWQPVATDELKKEIGLVCEFDGLSGSQLRRLRLLFNNFPFTWYEAGRKEGYYQAHSAIPTDHLLDSLRFLSANLVNIVSNWRTYSLDLATSYWYTIPYENFDDKRKWVFDRENALSSILSTGVVAKNMRVGP